MTEMKNQLSQATVNTIYRALRRGERIPYDKPSGGLLGGYSTRRDDCHFVYRRRDSYAHACLLAYDMPCDIAVLQRVLEIASIGTSSVGLYRLKSWYEYEKLTREIF